MAVDGRGNLYIADPGNGSSGGQVYVETLSEGRYVHARVGEGLFSPVGVAVDGDGNVYIADADGNGGSGAVYKETLLNGKFVQTTIGNGFVTPSAVAVDGNGNVYVSSSQGAVPGVYKESLTNGTYVQSTVGRGWVMPEGIAVSGNGDVFVVDQEAVNEVDMADPPVVKFAKTARGSTSTDSPRRVTVENGGNASLNFAAIDFPADFPQSSGSLTDCTQRSSLGAEQGCTLTIDFQPVAAMGGAASEQLRESVDITTNTLNTITQQSIVVEGTETNP